MNDSYKIYTRTPMGNFEGILQLRQKNGGLVGTINFNGKNFDFYNGEVNGNKFKFNGIFNAFFKRISYNAEGEIQKENIVLYINTNMGNFKIEGKKL